MENSKSVGLAEKIKDETFDMDIEEIRKLGYQAVDLMVDYFQNIPKETILPDKTLDQMKKILYEPLPQNGKDPLLVLDECQEKIIENAVRVGSPRFLGWILASGTPIGAFADGISSAINQNVAISGSGMATATELLVLDWIKEILGYDIKSGGILVSGGSIANLTALAVARNVKADFDVRTFGMKQGKNMILYVSKEVHVCIPKAANLLGIGTNNVRMVNLDDRFRMDINDLEKKIIEDKKSGKYPIAVVATAGTVNTGAIDPLDDIANICQKYNLWFHVDAAYGGFATLSQESNHLFNGLKQADSIVVDPHKWLFMPYEAGCVLVKNPSHLTETFSMKTDYLHIDNDKKISFTDVDFSDYGIQLSREFRALKIWMSLKVYGIKRYEQIINQNILLSKYIEALIAESDDFIIESPANLSIVCFRYVPKNLLEEYSQASLLQKDKFNTYFNSLNKSILTEMRLDGRGLLSSTSLHGKYVLRSCIVNYRTKKSDIVKILEIVRNIGYKKDSELRSKLL